MADWVSIKADYVSGGGSFKALSEKYGISVSAIKRKSATDGGWKANRTETEPKVYQKTVQKVIERKATHEADRITRILAVNDMLLEKAERGVSELGEYYIVKRKVSRTEPVKNQEGVVIGIADVDETAEVATKGPAIVDGAAVRHFAAALKDLNEIAARPKADEQSIAKVAEMMNRLDGEAAQDGVSKPETDGVQA